MKDNGGYIYPQETGRCHGNGAFIIEGGKTLLDDFAGQAMQVLLTDEWSEAIEEIAKDQSVSHNATRSEWCYDIAEAMVEEKRKREE